MKKVLGLILLTLFMFNVKPGNSQEIKYKAMFIYNFTKHIGWPPTAKSGDFVIGILGDNAVYNKLSEITSSKMAGSQNIVVKKYSSLEEMDDCHIIFVGYGKSTDTNMKNLIQNISGKNTLLVTEKKNLTDKGAAINFIIEGDQMRFELNKENALKQGLQISLNLEKLAILT